MNTAKLTILKNTFETQFNIERFKKFTREFFNEPEMLVDSRRTGIWREYDNHINSYYTIAKYTDSENNNLIVLAVELKKDGSIDRARSMQRNFISKVLDENKLEAAIVAFYTENDPSWRLSFVRLDYSFKETGISLDLTPARRYSYLLGENEPNNTAQAQLLPIFQNDRHNPTLDEIENAFSVEKVTKDFYSLYEDKYLTLKKYLDKDPAFIEESKKLGFEGDKFSEQFAKKLMGQLAFLYFLQKKGWLGVRIMPEDHTLSEIEFRKIYTCQDQAHRSVLDKFFKMTKEKNKKLSSKELLNTNDHEAALLSDCFMGTAYDMPWGSGNRTFIREIFDFCINHTTKNFFDDYLEPFFYEALNTKRKNQYFKTFNCKIPFLNGGLFEPLEGYHWKDVDFEIPNELFSNREQKDREADGILDIFDRFNFTINEDEPLEKEVAVDPEMLGKIFENLLDASDRKSKGAFYTPREIVHYMCQESLINYLVNEANVPYEDMKQFILYGELIRDADSRRNVGYGKEFTIKQSIYDNIVKIDKALESVKVADPAVGSGAFPLGMLNEIVKARNNITEYIIRKNKEGVFDRKFGEDFIRKRRAPYKMKWDTIRNSIFAVDIEPSAVDIAKLRLWLSVVVEQEIDAENPEPHPLPNLDMNIHVGNSLIDEYEGIKLFDKSILSKKNDEGKDSSTRKTSEMVQLSLLIDHTDDILKDMFALQDRYFDEDNEERKKEIKGKIDQIRDELIRYKLQGDNDTSAIKRYQESLKNKTKPYFIWEMEFAKIFKEKGGFDIVIGNPPYISAVEYSRRDNKTREYLRNKHHQLKGAFDIYAVFLLEGILKTNSKGIYSWIIPNKLLVSEYAEHVLKDLKNNGLQMSLSLSHIEVFENVGIYPIIVMGNKIDSKHKYKELVANTLEDLRTGTFTEKRKMKDFKKFKDFNMKFGSGATGFQAKQLVNYISEIEVKNSMPFIVSGAVNKYRINFNNIRYMGNKYPRAFIIRGEDVADSKWSFWSNEKIVIAGMTKVIEAVYCKKPLALGVGIYALYDYGKFNPKYLLGVLNSKYLSYYLNFEFKEKHLAGGYLAINKSTLEQLPLVEADSNIQEKVKTIVDQIYLIIEHDDNPEIRIKELAAEIDKIVYSLFELSPEEINEVEEFFIKEGLDDAGY